VPRRVPVPQQPLDRLLRQRFAKAKDAPAMVARGSTVTCGQLLENALALAGGIQSAETGNTVALVSRDRAEQVTILLAALFAGKAVFMPDPAASPDQAAAQLGEAQVSAILEAGEGEETLAASGIPRFRKAELYAPFKEAPRPKRATDPAILFGTPRGVVLHSHFSLCAISASLAAFIPGLKELGFLSLGPLEAWETLAGVLTAFLNGMPVALAAPDELRAAKLPQAGPKSYAIVSRGEIDAMLAEGYAPRAIKETAQLLVSTDHFAAHWRRRAEHLLKRPICPMWGLPEVGPIVAAHPTWLPFHGHGFPLVNVSLVPIDPESGHVSIVPWEMLERAEAGVESLSAMVGYVDPARTASGRIGKIMRTGQIVTMDHVGVVILHEAGAHG
jgi:acyl-CoA synthetase (AMP-forming)/AMP-acid ligase II